jgi:hypothetical protein
VSPPLTTFELCTNNDYLGRVPRQTPLGPDEKMLFSHIEEQIGIIFQKKTDEAS